MSFSSLAICTYWCLRRLLFEVSTLNWMQGQRFWVLINMTSDWGCSRAVHVFFDPNNLHIMVSEKTVDLNIVLDLNARTEVFQGDSCLLRQGSLQQLLPLDLWWGLLQSNWEHGFMEVWTLKSGAWVLTPGVGVCLGLCKPSVKSLLVNLLCKVLVKCNRMLHTCIFVSKM